MKKSSVSTSINWVFFIILSILLISCGGGGSSGGDSQDSGKGTVYPDRPPGHQPPPGDCNELRSNIPPGAWLIRG
jgi:hypothetical protein